MVRGLSLLSLLATLLAVGWLLTAQSSQSGQTATRAVDQAQQTAAGVAFEQAQAQLEQFHALNGTYAGASLRGFGVGLVRADASTYCLQTGSGSSVAHLAGPGGTAASGHC
jgi:Tfp pilus assembly protein PilE